MKNNIRNYDKNNNLHGEQITYHPNGNIWWIYNYHHAKWNGYQADFNSDKSIGFKQYLDMGNRIYEEDHGFNEQIEIKI